MVDEFDMSLARRNLYRRNEVKQAKLDRLFEEAQRDFRAIVDLIVRDYQPTRIYQWGSLLDREKFTGSADIDVGVEGIDGVERFFGLLDAVDRLSRFPVDIVEMEKIEPEFREVIERKGRLVYERKG
jgi:predicted nucleotidyltransferase